MSSQLSSFVSGSGISLFVGRGGAGAEVEMFGFGGEGGSVGPRDGANLRSRLQQVKPGYNKLGLATSLTISKGRLPIELLRSV